MTFLSREMTRSPATAGLTRWPRYSSRSVSLRLSKSTESGAGLTVPLSASFRRAGSLPGTRKGAAESRLAVACCLTL